MYLFETRYFTIFICFSDRYTNCPFLFKSKLMAGVSNCDATRFAEVCTRFFFVLDPDWGVIFGYICCVLLTSFTLYIFWNIFLSSESDITRCAFPATPLLSPVFLHTYVLALPQRQHFFCIEIQLIRNLSLGNFKFTPRS